jgi:uncharacterized protein (TIGR02145 family)
MRLLSKVNIFILFVPICFNCSKNDNTKNKEPVVTVTDIDGNIYNTIIIGNQTWMLENLKTLTFNDGTPISEYLNGMDWGDLPNQMPQYQWPIESGKLAPEGWRIPSQADFEVLENYSSEKRI